MHSMQTGPLLEASGIWKSFAGVKALKGVSFELLPGEVHALVGENGAGKSTLIKVMSGALTPDAGVLNVRGHAVVHNTPSAARAAGIAVIYQQPALFPHLTVAENVGIALESSGVWRLVNWRERETNARKILGRIGAAIDSHRIVESLSMPEQQIVEIAKVIGADARILIMDEPTASLTDTEVNRLFDAIRSLRAHGVGIIYISHRLEEISTIADRVTVLRDGETVATRPMSGVTRSELIRMMVGRELASVFPKREVPIGAVILEVRNVSSHAAGVRDLSVSVRAGEILGVAGLVGSGRTEFAEVLFGLRPIDSGMLLLRDKLVSISSPEDAVRAGIAYLPEDRRQHGVVLPMTVVENTTLASLHRVSKHGLIDADEERTLAASYVERLRIKTASLYSEAISLSGGNQQKVALARWLATRPRVLVLDEPTQGVDVGSKSEIHRLMVDLAEQGLAIIMISSELAEILGMSDRIAVMHEGRIAGVLERSAADPQAVLSLALGHAYPEALH
jgi:rhamnose transport system ATP-binding protein